MASATSPISSVMDTFTSQISTVTPKSHSMLSTLQRLPPELLLMIFRELLEVMNTSLSLISSALVCHTWNACLRSDSSLWTRLLIDLPTLEAHPGDVGLQGLASSVKLALDYSQGRPLTLTVNLVYPDGESSSATGHDDLSLTTSTTKILDYTLERCHELTVSCSLWSDMELLAGAVEKRPLPFLQSFHIAYQPSGFEAFSEPHALPLWRPGGISPLLVEPPRQITSVLPSLKQVVIDNLTHEWGLFSLTSLTSLHFRNIPDHNSPTYGEFRAILEASRDTLTSLELSSLSLKDIQFVGGRFTLPNLTTLLVSFADPRDLMWIAQTLDPPSLKTLTVDDHTVKNQCEERRRRTVESFREVMRCFPLENVETLVLKDVELYELEVEAEALESTGTEESGDGDRERESSSLQEGENAKSSPSLTDQFCSRFRSLVVFEAWHTETSLVEAFKHSDGDNVLSHLNLYLERLN
ncbi:hypothetical protein V5O48_009108 [Marasmius crinis-equi]|uniref:F-box domain-containing protein n=1 Tax=Marasmius crinis-equi TaxID=585013 RepID=A0ABR3FCP2_9AGAR